MTLTSSQQGLAAAALRLARRFGVGGEAWDVYAPTGDGVTANVTRSLLGAWAGHVVRGSDTSEAASNTGPVVARERWEAAGASAELEAGAGTLAAGHILVSQAEPARAYLVGSPIPVAGYARWQVTPCASPA